LNDCATAVRQPLQVPRIAKGRLAQPAVAIRQVPVAVDDIGGVVTGEKRSDACQCAWEIEIVSVEEGEDFSARVCESFIERSGWTSVRLRVPVR
jgi:hypothetical protein